MPFLLAGRLRLVDPVGAGGTATVWRAWDAWSRRFVAAKLVPSEHLALADPPPLRHSHVLTPHESLRFDGTVVHLMRLVRGGTADRLLADHGALPTAYVAVLLDQLLDALGALHAAGFVHRDVKPANLLLEPTGTGRPHLWLGDLGVATRTGESTTVAGTEGYLGPEVVEGAPADPRHDLFAAGVTAAELLTGRVPRTDRDLPRGPLRPLLRGLLRGPDHQPTADEARAALRAIGVPADTPWVAQALPPDVPVRLPRLGLVTRWRVQGVRAAQ